jgi:hypothetical protein
MDSVMTWVSTYVLLPVFVASPLLAVIAFVVFSRRSGD